LYKYSRRAAIANIYDGVKLKRLLDQRWTGHLDTVQVILHSFTDIVDMLTIASSSSSLSGDLVALAVGYLSQVSDLQFRFTAEILQTVLVTLKPANIMLQANNIDLVKGIELIESCISSIQQLRNDETFNTIWNRIMQHSSREHPAGGIVEEDNETVAQSQHNDEDLSNIVPHKRLCQLSSRYRDSIVMSSVGQRTERMDPQNDNIALRTESKSRFIDLIDLFLKELNNRFSERGKDYVRALAGLVPNTDRFLDLTTLKPLLDLCHIDLIKISHEIHVAKPMLESMLAKLVKPSGTFAKTNHVLEVLLPFRDGFPLLVKVVATSLTFGVRDRPINRQAD